MHSTAQRKSNRTITVLISFMYAILTCEMFKEISRRWMSTLCSHKIFKDMFYYQYLNTFFLLHETCVSQKYFGLDFIKPANYGLVLVAHIICLSPNGEYIVPNYLVYPFFLFGSTHYSSIFFEELPKKKQFSKGKSI